MIKPKFNSLTPAWLESRMALVINEGWRGVSAGQCPFAAGIFTVSGECMSLESNQIHRCCEPSRHAEVVAIDAACRARNAESFSEEVWLLSTAEPCPICTSVAAMAGVTNIAFGSRRVTVERYGYETLGLDCERLIRLANEPIRTMSGVLESECDKLLKDNPKYSTLNFNGYSDKKTLPAVTMPEAFR